MYYHCFNSPREYSRWKEERRSENYLSFEFQDRLLQQSIKYKLQIQLHKIKSGDSHLILHPARSWDQGTHPWLDLADVTLTSLLPCDVLQDTRCSVQNSPPTITIPPAKTIYDYNSIAFLSTKVYGFLQRKSSIQTLCSNVQDQSIYCISVRTGDRKRAGTDAMVSLTITGEMLGGMRYVLCAIYVIRCGLSVMLNVFHYADFNYLLSLI